MYERLIIDGNSVYIGSTSQYRLQPIEDKLNTIILVNDKPMLINYKVRLIRHIQGGNWLWIIFSLKNL